MRPQFLIVLGFLILAFSIQLNAQQITSFSLEPSAPEEGDSVYMIVDLSFNHSDCSFLGKQLSVSPDTFFIRLCHFEGLFPATCNSTDTILVGADMTPGTYTIELIVKNTGSMIDLVCNVANTGSDTAYHSFTVTEKSVGIAENDIRKIQWNSLVRDKLQLRAERINGTLMLYSITGQFLFQKEIKTGNNNHLDLSTYENGMYLLQFIDKTGYSKSGKITILH